MVETTPTPSCTRMAAACSACWCCCDYCCWQISMANGFFGQRGLFPGKGGAFDEASCPQSRPNKHCAYNQPRLVDAGTSKNLLQTPSMLRKDTVSNSERSTC